MFLRALLLAESAHVELGAMSLTDWRVVATIIFSLCSLYLAWKAHQRDAKRGAESRRASIDAVFAGGSHVSGQLLPHTFSYMLRNVGQSPPLGGRLWLADRHEGRKVSTEAAPGSVLIKDDPPVHVSVDLLEEIETKNLMVMLAWTDDEGPHEESSLRGPT